MLDIGFRDDIRNILSHIRGFAARSNGRMSAMTGARIDQIRPIGPKSLASANKPLAKLGRSTPSIKHTNANKYSALRS